MRERLIALHERRGRLLSRAAAERESLAAAIARIEIAERWIDAGASFVRRAGIRPLWAVGAIAFLIGLRPRRALKWAASGWSLWRLWRRARPWLQRLHSPAASTGPGHAA